MMTSESEHLKTNEFLRRRKLRLQQVREQSKDIAKKLRHRANVEKFQLIDELKNKKEKDYLKHQAKLVKRLEELYAQGAKSVGASHNRASAIQENASIANDKEDLSKLRGKEAASELRRKKQEKLDQQKKTLDRRLLARETANELSREKVSRVANKLVKATANRKTEGTRNPADTEAPQNGSGDTGNIKVNKNDMATQWDSEELTNEWEPNVPELSLPKDDRDSVKESNNIPGSKSDRSKRLDLFALSSEMPSSLRGGLGNVSEERTNVRPSLTMVSEYLQNRALRLRENVPTKKHGVEDNLHSLKQTIQHIRSSKFEGTSNDVCHVLDEQIIPVPSWQAESTCEFCLHHISRHNNNNKVGQFTVTNSEINQIFSSIRSRHADFQPSPVVRGSSPFRRNKSFQRTHKYPAQQRNVDKCIVPSDAELLLNRKKSVTMYNHSTRNTKDIAYGDPGLVVREMLTDGDAYADALKEMSTNNTKEKEHFKKLQEMRSKVAITKQNVEKEYSDTMSFLKSLPKERCSKHVRMSHMDEKRQQMQKDRHQLKLQRDFNKIEREARKISELPSKCKVSSCNKKRSKSPVEAEFNDGFESRDILYSWMPVPESDGNLAIHTIPTTLKEGKSGNTVKFSKVDSYHEYRSRHKHTPPTKETNKDKIVETIHLQNDESGTSDHSSSCSDTSSVENLNLQKKKTTKQKQNVSDEENVVIYKILNSNRSKKEKEKKRLKLIDDVTKVLNAMNKEKVCTSNKDNNNNKDSNSGVPIEQINEGVYKVVNEKGDNISSLYFSENAQENNKTEIQNHATGSSLRRNKNKNQHFVDDTALHSGNGEEFIPRSLKSVESRNISANNLKSKDFTGPHPSAATSTASFKTAAMNEKSAMLGSEFIKQLDDNGQEAGKFYIGASGFLNDDAYEITIQLKKKESTKMKEKSEPAKLNETVAKENNYPTMETKNPDELSTPIPNATEPLPNKFETTTKLDCDKYDINKNPDTESTLRPPKESSLHSPDTEGIIMNAEATEKCVDKPPLNLSKEKMDNACRKFVDVGVFTTSHLSTDMSCVYSKSDVPPRPATSTYTQTTLNSPNSKPVYIHMSSSTSTAYMSPPETILPKCLRQNYTESRRNQYSICYCQQCLLYQKISVNNVKSIPKSNMKSKNDLRNTSPPPNTARNNFNKNLEYNWHLKPSSRKPKCRKCDSRVTSSTNLNLNTKLKRSRKISSYICTTRQPSNATNSKISEKMLRSNLNPVIEKYINKLLELNSNGLKAIEIANQECSSVSTPGSSIIDVSKNINNKSTDVNNKISLEQIKILLKQKILEECVKDKTDFKDMSHENRHRVPRYSSTKVPKPKRSVHKIKSLNISKKILRTKKSNNVIYSTDRTQSNKPCSTSSPSSTGIMHTKRSVISDLKSTSTSNRRIRSRSSPTPRYANKFESTNDNTCSDISDNHKQRNKNDTNNKCAAKHLNKPVRKATEYMLPLHKATFTAPDSEDSQTRGEFPANTSTQTRSTTQDLDGEINLIKMAEDKIQNMEKIADLTEKCTKRLSNLAKILEEVRKNKSSAYSHKSTSDTASDNDYKSDKSEHFGVTQHKNPVVEESKESTYVSYTGHETGSGTNTAYISILKDIPKPEEFKFSNGQSTTLSDLEIPRTPENHVLSKARTRPPPALSRITLKHGQDIIPHELSTVVEVDSPMSLKLKNQSSKGDIQDTTNQISSNGNKKDISERIMRPEQQVNPDLLQNSNSIAKTNIGLPDDSKIQMMDLKQFNDVMLKPFISLQEYAKQCDVGILDEGSNMDDNVKDDLVNEELSSLHSDGSLPDVIAELLKRNIIAEPFKFDTVSNVNSTTVSSESTLSVIALSKVRNNKKKASVAFQNKENISETSDTLSFSSNPDLENAFKKLGMGWASSTLKKTKERLALSSSTNTSSSSLTQFKTNQLKGQEIPALVTDSVLSVSKTNRRKKQGKDSIDKAKNAEQQTSFMTSMTVKEFLTNELAKKITFTNKSHRNESGDEFISLLETKMPDEMKQTSVNLREEHSMDSLPSGGNRARTSTPVQIFKSMTYHSSSSSNISNGLFSNADDLSSVKVTSNSMRNHSNSDKGDLTIPNCSLKVRKGPSDSSKSD